MAFVNKGIRGNAVPCLAALCLSGTSFAHPPVNLPTKTVGASVHQIRTGTSENNIIYKSEDFDFGLYDDNKNEAKEALRYVKFTVAKEHKRTFFKEVSEFNNKLKLSKARLAAVLRVQRKSIYDWRDNPAVEVRQATKERLKLLNEFISRMDVDHRPLLGKLIFGREHPVRSTRSDVNDFRKALLSDNLDLESLEISYDKLWSELEAMRFQGAFNRTHKG